MLIRTAELTDGERLLVDRRRWGWTQAESAKSLGISLYSYRRAELDQESCDGGEMCRVSIGTLRGYEQCLIKRTRSGKSVNDLARVIGICSWWLTQMERGDAPVERLLAHWS